jgi:hypothetical protein
MTPRVQINVAFDPDLAFRLKAEADLQKTSVAQLIRRLVAEHLAKEGR